MGIFGWLAGVLIAAAIAGVVISVIVLTLSYVLDWFGQQESLSTYDANILAITVKQELDNGNVQIIQGVLNRRQNKLETSRKINASRLDGELAERHRYDDVVVYDYYEY
jgi:hypothetical protein